MPKTLCYPLALVLAATLVAGGAVARGESKAGTGREITMVAKPGKLDILRTVPIRHAAAAVVSDVAGVLVVAHGPKKAAEKREKYVHLSLFRLDDKGEVSGDAPKTIVLPTSPKIKDRVNYALALAVHPKHPLLYVWQDIPATEKGKPADDPKTDGYRHLQVYDISSEPRLLQSLADGETFSRGNSAAAIALDRNAERLFIPNMRGSGAKATPAIGYYRVLEDGMVVPNEEELVETGGEAGTSVDRTRAIGNLARKQYLEQTRSGTIKSYDRTIRYATSDTSTFGNFPAGLGFINISDTVTIVCGPLGPITWDEANRRAQFNSIVFYPVVNAGNQYRMAGHAKLPVLFFTGMTRNDVFRMEHADGFMTLLPQHAKLAGVTSITSPPVLLGNRPMFACASSQQLHLVGFDAQGRFTGEQTDVTVENATIESLAYSPRFDRLYATVVGAKQ